MRNSETYDSMVTRCILPENFNPIGQRLILKADNPILSGISGLQIRKMFISKPVPDYGQACHKISALLVLQYLKKNTKTLYSFSLVEIQIEANESGFFVGLWVFPGMGPLNFQIYLMINSSFFNTSF